YFDTEPFVFYDRGAPVTSKSATGNSLWIENIGFTEEVNQGSLNSLIVFGSGTMFMADNFISGTQITSIQIGNGNLETNNLHFYGNEEEFDVGYFGIYYCESHPEAFADVTISVYQDRIIQFLINPRNPMNCPVTLKITKGIYNGSADGNGTITDEVLIYNKSIPMPDSRYYKLLSITPSFRCRAQTTKNNCTTMSTRRVPCAWCPGTNICVLRTSSRACQDRTVTSRRNDGANEISTGVH
ncbi:Egg protein, partial [Schistosoma japonicum]